MQPSRLDIFRKPDDPAPLVVAKEAKVKAPKPKQEKAPRAPAGTRGGGWQVKADWVGKGMKIQCKAPYDGSFWECDHDTLVDAINASLKAKGKTLIGEPGPSEKQYGATSGLREPQLWTRVQ